MSDEKKDDSGILALIIYFLVKLFGFGRGGDK